MTPITRAQRVALRNIYDRQPIYDTFNGGYYGFAPLTYRQFRKRVHYASYDPCIMVQWCGMWLGIEPDGYTHS